MSKRFTESEIWNEDWFIELSKEYKLFWFYLKDKCNHAGIWKPNKKDFEFKNDCKIDLNEVLKIYNQEKQRIQILKNGHWFIIDFFAFQYGNKLNINSNMHKSIYAIYLKENIDLTSIRGLREVNDTLKDKDMDKDKDKDKDKEEIRLVNDSEKVKVVVTINFDSIFKDAVTTYPGTKRGVETEFTDFKKKHKDHEKAIQYLLPAIFYEIDWRIKAEKFNAGKKDKDKIHIPSWKNFKTWLSQRCWEQVLPEIPETKEIKQKFFE